MAKYQHLLNTRQQNLIRTLAFHLRDNKIGLDCLITRDRGSIAYIKFSGDGIQATRLNELENVLDKDLDVLDDLGFISLKESDLDARPIRYRLNERRIISVDDANFDISEDELNDIGIKALGKRFRRTIEQIARESNSTIQVSERAIPIPDEIQTSFAKFQEDHPDPSHVAFIIMSFSNSPTHAQILKAIQSSLRNLGIIGLRADDKEYHSDLYANMLTYIYGCQFGIAVFERIESDVHNPNVAYEVGYMSGMGKQVCLLKDKTITSLQADLIGKLYKPFDPQRVDETLPPVLSKWLSDKGFGSEAYLKLRGLYERLRLIELEYTSWLFSPQATNEQYVELIRESQDIVEQASKYDEVCPIQCLSVHTEPDADPVEFREVNFKCQDRLLYIAKKRLTVNQPTMNDNPLEGKIWGEYRKRNQDAISDALKRIAHLFSDFE